MALQILQKLEGNVAVCNVIGPLRTGKSYIMNILLNKKNGFELGGNVDSCTRGICNSSFLSTISSNVPE